MKIENQLLPPIVQSKIDGDDASSSQEIEASLTSLEGKMGDVDVDIKSVILLIRRLADRKKLKYTRDIPTLSRAFQLFHDIYVTKILSAPNKIRILKAMSSLISKKNNRLTTFQTSAFNWRFFWDETISIVTRLKKTHSMASEVYTLSLLTDLQSFLHSARMFISAKQADEIVAEANSLLKNTKLLSCIEGVILLNNCLPTSYVDYDKMLSQWVTIWASIEHNAYWDACWLTVLTRSRKYSTVFQWSSMRAALLAKSRQLLQVPTGKGRSPQQQEYPHSFPAYYSKMLVMPYEARKVALNKIAKLLYFLTLQSDPISSALVEVEIITVTPPKLSSDGSDLLGGATEGVLGFNKGGSVSSSVSEIALFYQSLRPYFYPSNSGRWTELLGFFICTMVSELCRHVSRSMAFTILGHSSSLAYGVFEQPTHIISLRFLLGTMTTLVMEGLYSKVPMMQQLCSSSLKNICSIDPAMGHIIVPFILQALDPQESLNHSHQAPAAMQAMTLCFKQLLYPSPVIMQYLPILLTNTLPGIDPNDNSKTIITLSLYSTILSFLPLRTNPSPQNPNTPPAYLSLMNSTSPATTVVDSSENYNLHAEAFSGCIVEWSSSLLDKIFVLLEAAEEKKKGSNPSPVGGAINECIGYLFQSIDAADPLRVALVDKVLAYFQSHSPINAAKTSAKMFEALVNTRPDFLSRAFSSLIDSEVLSGSCSVEKLAFRIRLLGGCVRLSVGENLAANFSVVAPLIDRSLLQHSDKGVRKCAAKLAKDLLKGSSAFYPINVSPINVLPHALTSSVLGAPSDVTHSHKAKVATWHTPTPTSLHLAVQILKSTAIVAMTEIDQLLLSSISPTCDGSTAPSTKHVEETIGVWMGVLRKALRGAADVLGDELSEEMSSTENSKYASETDINATDECVEDGVDGSGEGISEWGGGVTLLSTGREAICGSGNVELSQDDSAFLSTLRHKVLFFLHKFSNSLSTLAATEGNAYRGLGDNEKIRGQWMKIVTVIVTQRSANLKNVDNLLKWVEMTKRMSTSVLVKQMNRIIENEKKDDEQMEVVTSSGWMELLSQKNYWKGHDLNTNDLANSGWLQHASRLQLFAFASLRVSLNNAPFRFSLYDCLDDLAQLCGHEWDIIRSKAQRSWQGIAGRFGVRIMRFLKPFLQNLTQVGVSFHVAMGSLMILSQKGSMQRIIGEWETLHLFLHSLSAFPVVCASVPENEKRERLMRVCFDTFVRYLDYWNHLPLTETLSLSPPSIPSSPNSSLAHAHSLMLNALANVGYLDNQSSSSSSSTETMTTTTSHGLRHEAMTTFSLLHMIGHDHIQIDRRVTEWALNSVMKMHPPTQLIGLAALIKIGVIAYLHVHPTPNLDVKHSKEFSDSQHEEIAIASRSLLLQSNVPSISALKLLLQGISLNHPHIANSAQWMKGIDKVLHTTNFIKSVVPRYMTSFRSDKNYFSNHFEVETSAFFMSLPAMLKLTTIEEWVALTQALKAACKDLEATSEEEERTNNSTRAEVFAGIFRAMVISSSSLPGLRETLEPILVTWISDSIDKLSKDFGMDWAEGVYFATTYARTPSSPLLTFILDGFHKALQSGRDAYTTSSASSSSAASSSSSSSSSHSEGFSKHEKSLALTRSILWSDACFRSTEDEGREGMTVVSDAILKEICAGSCISPYRSMRAEIASIVGLISETSFASQRLIPTIEQFVATITPTTSAPSLTAMSDEEGNSEDSAVNTIAKSACETIVFWLNYLIHAATPERREKILPLLLKGALIGCSSAEAELAKMCKEICLSVAQAMGGCKRGLSAANVDSISGELSSVLSLYASQCSSSAWRVRETSQECLTIVMCKCWWVLTAEEKKTCKDVLMEGLNDTRPEIVEIVKEGMILYLSFKSAKELQTLTAAYIRNSEAIATRERQRRKQQSSQASLPAPPPSQDKAVADRAVLNTVQICCCLVLAFPYDLPAFVPPLLASVVKHSSTPIVQDLVMKSVQAFKRTHQDRWDYFKTLFTHEQLDDLQGVGAASYFS